MQDIERPLAISAGGGAYPRKDHCCCSIIGTARCVSDDIRRCGINGDVMVISHALMGVTGRVHHAISMHWNLLIEPLFRLRMSQQQGNVSYVHSWRKQYGMDSALGASAVAWRAAKPRFSPKGSGHFAVLTALSMGYSEIRLLGLPMDGSPHFYDINRSSTAPCFHEWLRNWILPEGAESRIRSASGNTSEQYGRIPG